MGVKGSAFQSVAADVNRLVEEGRISRAALEARLEAEDLEILDDKIVPALWYPFGTFGRLTELLYEIEGRHRSEYLVERGRAAARRIQASGLYSQLKGDRAGWGERMGKMLATLGPAMYKDTEWRFELTGEEGGPRGFRLEVDVPTDFPELCRYPTQGFVDFLSEAYGGELAGGARLRVTSERPAPGRIVIHGLPPRAA